jgi:NAD(P)-dependent dehydrogenase (short-subunit alcohol dehydrogenase family)
MPTATAIVTGASKGLGLALSRQLAARGWRVVVDARDARALHEAVEDLENVIAVPGDITDPEHRKALVAAAGDRIDAVINNAGTLGPSPLPGLTELHVNALGRLLNTNVLAPLALVQIATARLTPNAAILNITSDAAVEAYAGWGGYGASKAALEQISAVLAVEHPELRVYAVDPGDMRTEMHQLAFEGEDISDRPWPEDSVPAIVELIEGERASGRYRAAEVFV